MQAPNLATLYDFETQIESAVDSLFTTNSLAPVKQRDSDSAVTPRTTIQFTTGSPSEFEGRNATQKPRPAIFDGTLRITVVTDRTQNTSSHPTFRGTIRAILYDYVQQFTTTLLPYLQILRMRETGTSVATDDENNQDTTEMSWAVVFCIRKDAWPL